MFYQHAQSVELTVVLLERLPLEKAKEDFQRRYVHEALERNNGNRTQTARDLGVDPRTIFRYLERDAASSPSTPGPLTREDGERE